MKRRWRNVHCAAAWTGAVCLGLLLPLPLIAEPAGPACPAVPAAPKKAPVVPGPETRNPDDFELFLENILEAPRGQKAAVPGATPAPPRYAPASSDAVIYANCPLCRAAAAPEAKAPTPAPAGVSWRTDYGKARDEAKDKGRPLVIVFRSEFCSWCDKLDAAIRDDADVSKLLNDGVVPVELSGTDNPAVAASLKIDAYPTVVVAAPDGKILGRLVGYRDAATLKKEIQQSLDKAAAAP